MSSTSQEEKPSRNTDETDQSRDDASPESGSQDGATGKEDEDSQKPVGKKDQLSDATTPSTPDDKQEGRPRQVIAVSAAKGPAAFFNLSRKFLVTDDTCDLSALEGAIVTAVDAANLLERSQLAKIIRIQTSYVNVEPRRKTAPHQQSPTSSEPPSSPMASSPAVASSQLSETPSASVQLPPSASSHRQRRTSTPGRDLRRARIVITLQRTDAYRQWLESNPLQAIIAGDGGDDDDEVGVAQAEARAQSGATQT